MQKVSNCSDDMFYDTDLVENSIYLISQDCIVDDDGLALALASLGLNEVKEEPLESLDIDGYASPQKAKDNGRREPTRREPFLC